MEIEKEIKQQKKFKNEWHKLSVNLSYTHNWAAERARIFFDAYDLTTQQFNILRILRGQYPTPVSTSLIRERMIDKMSDTSRLVDRLCRKDLVKRSICGADKRLVDIIITEKGMELLSQIDTQESQMTSFYRNLDEEEAKQLNYLLDKLRG